MVDDRLMFEEIFDCYQTDELAFLRDEDDAWSVDQLLFCSWRDVKGKEDSPHTPEKLHDDFQWHLRGYRQRCVVDVLPKVDLIRFDPAHAPRIFSTGRA